MRTLNRIIAPALAALLGAATLAPAVAEAAPRHHYDHREYRDDRRHHRGPSHHYRSDRHRYDRHRRVVHRAPRHHYDSHRAPRHDYRYRDYRHHS